MILRLNFANLSGCWPGSQTRLSIELIHLVVAEWSTCEAQPPSSSELPINRSTWSFWNLILNNPSWMLEIMQ
jgi:hypothetical protein